MDSHLVRSSLRPSRCAVCRGRGVDCGCGRIEVMAVTERVWDSLTQDQRDAIIEDQRERCEDQGHEWENCCSIFLEIYQRCKWCGEKRK